MKKIAVYVIFILLALYFLFNFFQLNKKEELQTIKFSTWGSQSEIEVLREVIEDYEKNNKVKIKLIHIPQNYFQKLHLMFASNLAPDVVFINNQNIKMYIKANLLEDLNPYFYDKTNVFYDEAINCFKEDNALYAIPRDISNLVLYYNKEILKKEKVTLPTKFQTIYELENILTKLSNEYHFGINFEEDPLYWNYYVASNGGGILSDDKKSILLNSKETKEALELYASWIHNKKIAPSKSDIGSMTTAQMFINGKLAMYLGGRWMVPKFRETISFDWDVTAFPATSENKVNIDASGWAISKKSQNKSLAIDFIKHLSKKSTIDKFTESGLIIPSRKDSAFTMIKNDKNKKPLNSKAFINMLENAKPTSVNENYNIINDILKEETQSIFNGTTKEFSLNKKTQKKLEGLL